MNISLSEILLVLVVALLVVKPEQLPGAALRAGRFIKMLRQLLGQMKDHVNDLIDPKTAQTIERIENKPQHSPDKAET